MSLSKKIMHFHKEVRRKQKPHTAAELEELITMKDNLTKELENLEEELALRLKKQEDAKLLTQIGKKDIDDHDDETENSKTKAVNMCNVSYVFVTFSESKELEIRLTLENSPPDEVIRGCVLEWMVNGIECKNFTYNYPIFEMKRTIAHRIKWTTLLELLNTNSMLPTDNCNEATNKQNVNDFTSFTFNHHADERIDYNEDDDNKHYLKNKIVDERGDEVFVDKTSNDAIQAKHSIYNDITINVLLIYGTPYADNCRMERCEIALPHFIMYTFASSKHNNELLRSANERREKERQQENFQADSLLNSSLVTLRFDAPQHLKDILEKLITLFAPPTCLYSTSSLYNAECHERVRAQMMETFSHQLASNEPLLLELINMIDGNTISIVFENEQFDGFSRTCTIRGEYLQYCGRLIDAIRKEVVEFQHAVNATFGNKEAENKHSLTVLHCSFPYESSILSELFIKVNQFEAIRIKLTTEIADGVIAIKPMLVRSNEAYEMLDWSTMKETYSDVFDITRELIGEDAKRAANFNAFKQAVEEISRYVSFAHELFAGDANNEQLIRECANAVQRNQ